MNDCTTCKYTVNCDTEIRCKKDSMITVDLICNSSCTDYEPREDGLQLVQVWDWR